MRQSHGTTPGCVAAFVLAHQTRRFALMHAARNGFVTALDVRHEFPNSSRTNAHEVLHVLRDKGLLTPDRYVLDVQGKLRQLTYVPSPAGRAALVELCDWLNVYLSTERPSSKPKPVEIDCDSQDISILDRSGPSSQTTERQNSAAQDGC